MKLILAEMLRERVGSSFDNEATFSADEIEQIIAALEYDTPPPLPHVVGLPEGWKLVPRTPTDAMMQAGLYQSSHDATWSDVYSSWVDMVDAAEDPPTLASEGSAACLTCEGTGKEGRHSICRDCDETAPAEHLVASDDAVQEASIAARYHRLHKICERILWTDIGAPAMGNPQTQAAMTELSELMLTDALIAATATEGSGDA